MRIQNLLSQYLYQDFQSFRPTAEYDLDPAALLHLRDRALGRVLRQFPLCMPLA